MPAKAKKETKVNLKDKISSYYIEYTLEHEASPKSVFKFCKHLKISEKDFYALFPNFDSVEKFIWKNFTDQAIQNAENQEIYKNYSFNEKYLLFCFSQLEVWMDNRSFILFKLSKLSKSTVIPSYLNSAAETVKEFGENLINEGLSENLLSERPLLTSKYPDVLWYQYLTMLQFWIRDESHEQTDTDAYVEKSVKLAFDVMAPGAVDSTIDFFRFMFRKKSNFFSSFSS
ncbi:MAG: TetR/AcrR family transcriptional regulator [Chitinophagaceae bacterium]|nr:MAG: TetR/AcrR family transcriptional regulator [Chitinophagaceae bacterium]